MDGQSLVIRMRSPSFMALLAVTMTQSEGESAPSTAAYWLFFSKTSTGTYSAIGWTPKMDGDSCTRITKSPDSRLYSAESGMQQG